MNIEVLGNTVISAAIEVHKELGPGLLESTYERCLYHELTLRNLKVERQATQSINYKGIQIDEGYRIDLLVENQIILELKAVQSIADVHTAQLLTYLKLSGRNLGFLINFNTDLLKHGLKRIVHQLPE